MLLQAQIREGLKPSNRAAQYQGVDIVGALIGVHRFQVQHVPDNTVLVNDPVAAKHVPKLPSNVERLAIVIALDHRDHLGGLMKLSHPVRAFDETI